MTTALDARKQLQRLLGVEDDGVIGTRTREAFDKLAGAPKESVWPPEEVRTLRGDGTWSWFATVEGDDIVIRNAHVTAFGGASDNMDSGETASGINTARNPEFLGCALPLRRDALYDRKRGQYVLRGSPLPRSIPFRTKVVFTDPKSGKSVTTELIDLGPAKWTNNCGDLSVAAARQFKAGATANNFKMTLDIRIIGGAKYVTE